MNIVVFSGAGMSAESGISTFRDKGGLWERYSIEQIATRAAWESNPELVQSLYNERRKQIVDASPNKAHHLIKELEKIGEVTVITQNIDDLHERAGSQKVIHLHGNIRYSKSSGPNQETEYFWIDGATLNMTDTCSDGFLLRPHVVWFGKEVPMLAVADEIINKTDVLIIIGTSLQVYPAAGLIHSARSNCKVFVINPNAEQLNLPHNFTVIKNIASEGMATCLNYLK